MESHGECTVENDTGWNFDRIIRNPEALVQESSVHTTHHVLLLSSYNVEDTMCSRSESLHMRRRAQPTVGMDDLAAESIQ